MGIPGGVKYGASLAALACAIAAIGTQAQAGAFAVREQSAYFQGMSFAGAAAGQELSSMFWNSAAAAAAPGMNSETHVALVVPHTEVESTGTSLLDGALGLDTKSGQIGDPTPVPASYFNYQINEKLFVGMAINGQYGFTTKAENADFAGTPIATTSKIFSINFNPTVAYKISPELTIGVGAQILYADLALTSTNSEGVTAAATRGAIVSSGRRTEADDWGFGGTAGILWQPAPGTSIGVGYRSQIELEGKGTCTGFGLSNIAAGQIGGNATGCLVGANVEADLTLPDLVTASFRQRLNDQWTVLGTVEWQNWSVVGERAEFKNAAGQTVDVFPLDYDDGWFFSLGGEYKYSPDWTFRAGLGYELSPISDEVRNVSLPDNDRIWLSFGASHRLTEKITIDLAYTHLFVKDAPVKTASALGTLIEAEATGDIDILAASFKYHWGEREPELEPLK
jgi:long-chain fatty acid transport protein